MLLCMCSQWNLVESDALKAWALWVCLWRPSDDLLLTLKVRRPLSALRSDAIWLMHALNINQGNSVPLQSPLVSWHTPITHTQYDGFDFFSWSAVQDKLNSNIPAKLVISHWLRIKVNNRLVVLLEPNKVEQLSKTWTAQQQQGKPLEFCAWRVFTQTDCFGNNITICSRRKNTS